MREIRMLRCVSREGWRVQQESVLPGQKSEPRSLDSGGEGNRTFEAYRQGLPRGGYESPGRNKSERIVASKMYSRGPSLQRRGEGRMASRTLTDTAGHLGGVEATAR